jgi:hypothetical protein
MSENVKVVVSETAQFHEVVLVRADRRGVLLRVGGKRKLVAWDDLRAAANAQDHLAAVHTTILRAAEAFRREKRLARQAAAEEERRRSTGPWALALRGWWDWHAAGCQTYGAVGMPPNRSTASLVRRYQTKQEALAALAQIKQAERDRNRPWEGTEGDYEVRRYHASDYIPDQDERYYGPDPRFIQWA